MFEKIVEKNINPIRYLGSFKEESNNIREIKAGNKWPSSVGSLKKLNSNKIKRINK